VDSNKTTAERVYLLQYIFFECIPLTFSSVKLTTSVCQGRPEDLGSGDLQGSFCDDLGRTTTWPAVDDVHARVSCPHTGIKPLR
jgi:hypothetical protein